MHVFKNLKSVTLVTLSLLQSITEPVTIVLTFGAVNKQLCCTHLNETSFIIKATMVLFGF